MRSTPTSSQAANVPAEWLAGALNELDYGVLLINAEETVLHANRAAELQLASGHPLQVQGGQLHWHSEAHASLMKTALREVALRGTRRMVTLQSRSGRHRLSVISLARSSNPSGTALLVVLGRSAPCVSLSAYGFGSSCGLSDAEFNVLSRLIGGEAPARIAASHKVAISTVRTQISNIRSKTNSRNTVLLLREVAMLPPLVSVLNPAGGTSVA